jgi:hypothetical protein
VHGRGNLVKRPVGLPQLNYIAFVFQARKQATGALGHLHWFTCTPGVGGLCCA